MVEKVINTKLLFNPFNWAIILLMLLIAGAAGSFAMKLLNVQPATADNQSTN